MQINEEQIKICSVCDKKTDDWKCSVSNENIFSKKECPLSKWDKGFFPTTNEANLELQQLSINPNVLDKHGAVKIENLSREAFSAQFKKKNIEIKPHKNLLNRMSSIEVILYCINNFPSGGWNADVHKWDNVQKAYRKLCSEKASEIVNMEYPKERFSGKGIVMCGGNNKYYPSLYVNIRMLRLLGCELPIEVYYIGEKEMDPKTISILEENENVKCINACDFEEKYPIRIHGGWESKVYCIINSSFEEVLFMDADNTALVNPAYLFEEEQYKNTGAILWPDFECWKHDEKMWEILGIRYRKELQVESGQVLVNKSKCWKEINMAKYFCDYSDYYFKLFYGDKETFHFGWRYFDSLYGMPPHPDWIENGIIVQKDFGGAWVFSHRAQAKFKINKTHKICMSMPYEQETLDLIDELSHMWGGTVWVNDKPSNVEKEIIKKISNKKYKYIRVGLDEREMELLPDKTIGAGSDRLEKHYQIFDDKGKIIMAIHGESCLTALLELNQEDNVWRGKWLDHEKCKIELIEV